MVGDETFVNIKCKFNPSGHRTANPQTLSNTTGCSSTQFFPVTWLTVPLERQDSATKLCCVSIVATNSAEFSIISSPGPTLKRAFSHSLLHVAVPLALILFHSIVRGTVQYELWFSAFMEASQCELVLNASGDTCYQPG